MTMAATADAAEPTSQLPGSTAGRREGARRPLSLAALVALVVVLGGLFIGLAPLSDNSFLTHLATGRLIWDTGHIPRSDPYSFTAAGEPWVVQSWLPAALLGAIDSWFGAAGLAVFFGALAAGIAALVWALTRPAGGVVVRLAIAVLALGVGADTWTERPLLVGLLGLGACLLAAGGRLDARWLVPVMWVWVNSHGSYPMAIVALALLAAGTRLDGEPANSELRALKWAAVGVAIGVIGPLGIDLLLFPLHLLARQDVLRGIVEWQAPRFTEVSERVFLVEVALAVVAVARRPSWRAALPVVVFVPAALLGARNIPVASLVLLPTLASGLRGSGSSGDERRPAYTLAGILVAAVGVLAVVNRASGPVYDLDPYPVAAVEWLNDAELLAPDVRLVAPDYVGNYLEALRGDDAGVYIDDRYDFFPDEVIEDYFSLLRGDDRWDDVLDAAGADAVLWQREEALAQLLEESDNWDIEYEDDDWLVAVARHDRGGR